MQRPNQVLVIDDDEAAREILVELLARVGYHAFAAPDGRSGLEWLAGAAVPPQAVLLDLRMPVMSGWGLLEALKKLPRARGLPIIIISAYGFEWEAELVGASGYVSKPVDLDRVRETVTRILGPPPEQQMLH